MGPSPQVPLHHPPALTPLPCPTEMDFAKGLQKIVHNCRQSVMQEVGPWAWVRVSVPEKGQRKRLPICAMVVAEGT